MKQIVYWFAISFWYRRCSDPTLAEIKGYSDRTRVDNGPENISYEALNHLTPVGFLNESKKVTLFVDSGIFGGGSVSIVTLD